MKITVIILAAGEGSRMRSSLPKVLHRLGDRPLLAHVLDTVTALDTSELRVVYGHGGEQVRASVDRPGIIWIHQASQLGTGHAVQQAIDGIDDDDIVLVLYGDVPLITADTLHQLLAKAGPRSLALLTVQLPDPHGYGRIIRSNGGDIIRIVEEKDASVAQRQITEVNTGFMAAPAHRLRRWLEQLDNDNTQREYYLTDVVALAVNEGVTVSGVTTADIDEVMGVNTRGQLEHLERCLQRRIADQLMTQGVTVKDASRLDVRGTVTAGRDCIIDVNVVFEGRVQLGERVMIGPNCVIRNSVLADDVVIHACSVIDQAVIGHGARIGPFARIRPGSELAADVHIGNFVEIKKSTVGQGSKVNHLSYVGDATIGSGVNIGAGTITCNYDGANKHQTIIEDDVFVGSDCQLIAPVTLGKGSTIGAGSTINRDTPPEQLTLSRSQQKSIAGWQRPRKKDSSKKD
ncbi:MAG: bifunctional UDP-N-acetylglucosamine diphosphorylase/glucosamine-1-phosphate N-acetyltransferase GlmU [Gammaproteobacteria bacterium]|nr:bifunctional UDP-N-acetylglucosamine diphosphorylase/glucosamine-1-phosphate N-acetyltransferase GlmU [Gammaproteobacteria bacterium]